MTRNYGTTIPVDQQMQQGFTPSQPLTPTLNAFNPGIKPTGAPVNFNPVAQKTMTNMFGTPMSGSYDRLMDPNLVNNQALVK